MVKQLLKKVSLEPPILLISTCLAIYSGSGINQKLMLWKACHVELNYTETVCDNLTAEANDAVQSEVQIFVNKFRITNGQLTQWPKLLYVILAGSLSDRYGRKFLILLPVVGDLISSVFIFINYIFIRELPMEMYYLDDWYQLLGGHSLYYMGVYSHGSDITDPNQRSTTFAIYDGVETVGWFIGTLLSSYVFDLVGYYGVFSIRALFVFIAVCYFVIMVPSKTKQVTKQDQNDGHKSFGYKTKLFLKHHVLGVLKEFWNTLTQKRDHQLRMLLHIQLVIYFIFFLAVPYEDDWYLYMSKVFDNFTGRMYSYNNAVVRGVGIILLLVAVPLLTSKLKIHETWLAMGTFIIGAVGILIQGLAHTLVPGFVVGSAISALRVCQWPLMRALFTKTVGQDEVGKVFAAVAFIVALAGLVATPIMKGIYNATVDSAPATFLFYTTGLYGLIIVLGIPLLMSRKYLQGTPTAG